MRALIALLSGWLFALGLGLGGMTRPSKILGFLDVTGHWDPALLFLMGGALGVCLPAFHFILKRRMPVLGDRFHVPVRQAVDAWLVGGAVLFGVGWGLSGYCPGPALVSLVTLREPVLLFFGMMCLGLALGRFIRPKPAAAGGGR